MAKSNKLRSVSIRKFAEKCRAKAA